MKSLKPGCDLGRNKNLFSGGSISKCKGKKKKNLAHELNTKMCSQFLLSITHTPKSDTLQLFSTEGATTTLWSHEIDGHKMRKSKTGNEIQRADVIKEAAALMRRLRPVEVHSSICGPLARSQTDGTRSNLPTTDKLIRISLSQITVSGDLSDEFMPMSYSACKKMLSETSRKHRLKGKRNNV